MTTDEKRQFLAHVNDTGGDEVAGMLVQLIAEGYSVVIEPATIQGFEDDRNLPAFKVTTVKPPVFISDVNSHGHGQNTWLMEALSNAYGSTPETEPAL